MAHSNRRDFIKHLYTTSAVLAGGIASRQLASGQSTGPGVVECQTVTGPDMKAFNNFTESNGVPPQTPNAPAVSSRMTFKHPAFAYSVAQVTLG